MTIQFAWFIFGFFAIISILLIVLITIQKAFNHMVITKQSLARDYLFDKYYDQKNIKKKLTDHFFFDAYINMETQVQIEPEIREKVINDLSHIKFTLKQYKRLNSISVNRRKIAIFYLSMLNTDKAWKELKKRLYKEKEKSVLFALVHALLAVIDETIFDQIINTIIGANANYQRWVQTLLTNHYSKIKNYIPKYFIDKHQEVKKLLIALANNTIDKPLEDYVTRLFHESILEQDIKLLAIKALARMHPQVIANDIFCKSESIDVKRVAIGAASTIITKEMVDNLINSMDGSSLDEDRANSLSKIVYSSKTLFLYVLDRYKQNKNRHQQLAIAHVLSHRIDYLILKIDSEGYEYIIKIIEDMMKLHIIEDFIDFMNLNKDIKIENKLVPSIKKYVIDDKYLLEQFSIYLNEKTLQKIGIKKQNQPVIAREKATREKSKIRWIITWVTIAVVFFPLLFFITEFKTIFGGAVNVFQYLIISINNYLVVYFMAANLIYLILLFISLKGSKERLDLWNIKTETLLFEHDLLPSISIIAPAYNEEKSIIESITSLLNLKYPKFEVIVVNDGSKDETVNVLINHFELERKHPFFKLKLKTKTLRGVYVNKNIPNLIVIDKQNGGKADALNLGINVAKNDYVCGIDADSLLEEDALLKLMSITLDHTDDFIALGGNIVPVNGCIVDQGKIEHSGLGKSPLARFQTLEYLRAFTTGRIGWSKIKSLLIVSGAFGLFQRNALLETGGYLTISGELKKDTVGEDMELVVRLTYQALKKKKPYRVEYVHHANCYTELPNDLNSLLKQRNRWQRGLLDILSYHRNILFNPKYKQPGLLGFPYFFIFEMVGPFLEIIGYLALFIGLFLGILNAPLIIVLFAVTVGFGIVISLFSLFIAERRSAFYSNKETFLLVLVCIVENLGYRQMISLQRVFSTFSALRENGSWGSQKRQGFQKIN